MSGMIFEPVRSFNFRIELPPDADVDVSDLFSLSVESASINLIAKSGRIDVRDFSDSGKAGADLVRLYVSPVIPTLYVRLLSPVGDVVRTYVLKNNRPKSVVLNMSNGPTGRRMHAINSMYFEFDSFDIVTGSDVVLPEGVALLNLSYTEDSGVAEINY